MEKRGSLLVRVRGGGLASGGGVVSHALHLATAPSPKCWVFLLVCAVVCASDFVGERGEKALHAVCKTT